MKKIIIMLTLGVLILQLIACSPTETTGDSTGRDEEPADSTTFHFDDYEDFLLWMTQESNTERDSDRWGARFSSFINRVKRDPSALCIPSVGGRPMTLQQKEGLSGIVLMTNELYDLPWIWYYGLIDGKELVVRIACLGEEDLGKLNTSSASAMISAFSPDAPNVGTLSTHTGYRTIEERTVALDSVTVSGLYSEPQSGSRVYLSFSASDTLVLITANKEHLTSELLAALDIKQASSSPKG